MGDEYNLGAGNVVHQVLQVTGAQDGVTAFQLAGAGVQEGFTAGCQQEPVGAQELQTGLGGQGLQRGIGHLRFGCHQRYQRAAVVQRNGQLAVAQCAQILHESGVARGQKALEETGRIGQKTRSTGGAVKHHHGGGIRRNGTQHVPGGGYLFFCSARARRLV